MTAAASRAGVAIALVASEEALVAKSESLRPQLVIVDLSHPGTDPWSLAHRLQGLLPDEAMTVAFGPHVHKERLTAAAEAGFRLVVSRGQFHAEVDEILKRYA
ncbi:MAG: hypothetical protein WDZ48_06760 [Pirellulales bacterium]